METAVLRHARYNSRTFVVEHRVSVTRAPFTAIRALTIFPARLVTHSQPGTRPTTAVLRLVPPFKTVAPASSLTITLPTNQSYVPPANSAMLLSIIFALLFAATVS